MKFRDDIAAWTGPKPAPPTPVLPGFDPKTGKPVPHFPFESTYEGR